MQRNHLPAGLGQVLDEVETDKARAARDEGGLVRHGLRPLDYIGNSRALYAAERTGATDRRDQPAMFSLLTRTHVAGLSGREITDFLSTCNDEAFRGWWPGTHFHLHTVKGTPGTIGSVVFMDEMIGNRHVKVTCELTDLVPGKTLVWQLRQTAVPTAGQAGLPAAR